MSVNDRPAWTAQIPVSGCRSRRHRRLARRLASGLGAAKAAVSVVARLEPTKPVFVTRRSVFISSAINSQTRT
jgi:hypothetical protein